MRGGSVGALASWLELDSHSIRSARLHKHDRAAAAWAHDRGVLRPIGTAHSLHCENCPERHRADIMFDPATGRHAYQCHDGSIITLTRSDIELVQPDAARFAAEAAQALGFAPEQVRPRAARVLFELGVGQTGVVICLGIGLERPDAMAAAMHELAVSVSKGQRLVLSAAPVQRRVDCRNGEVIFAGLADNLALRDGALTPMGAALAAISPASRRKPGRPGHDRAPFDAAYHARRAAGLAAESDRREAHAILEHLRRQGAPPDSLPSQRTAERWMSGLQRNRQPAPSAA